MVAAPPQQGSQFNESQSNNKKRGILMMIAAEKKNNELYESQKIALAVWRMYLNAIMPTTNKHSISNNKPKHAINPSIDKIITTAFVKPSSIQPRGIVRKGLDEIQQAQSETGKILLTEEMVATFNKILQEMNNNNSCQKRSYPKPGRPATRLPRMTKTCYAQVCRNWRTRQ